MRRQVYRDAFIERGAPAAGAGADLASDPAAPPAARLRDGDTVAPLTAPGLGIALDPGNEPLVPGRWAGAAGIDGVYLSVATPEALAESPADGGDRRRSLDRVESAALAFLVAFDLRRYELAFALGNEHPRLGWSARVKAAQRDERQPGPDGFDRAEPLVRIGMVSPALQPRVAAAFTGGFKREHGAFRYGELALASNGSHYGFVEHGVVFSRLVPGLSTLYVTTDGSVDMKTWQDADARLLSRIRHARQNGVPLIERDAAGGPSAAGALVDQWGAGNWSGSADEKLRTLRAGACLLENATGRFLIYGYFSTATPRAMAQVFGAYGCTYAMHLDMNALEHTYLALYAHSGSRIVVEHLVEGMAVLDKRAGDTVLPRFLGFADDRDFFYLVSRQGGP